LYPAVNQPTQAITTPQPSAKASDQSQRNRSTVSTKDTAEMTTNVAAACRVADTVAPS
jgi:hypothetical protein